jgi:hypothetical protein
MNDRSSSRFKSHAFVNSRPAHQMLKKSTGLAASRIRHDYGQSRRNPICVSVKRMHYWSGP